MYLLANNEKQLSELARYCVPYVAAPGNSHRFERTLPYPLYVHHLHSFFYGGTRGLLLSVKWMLRTFCASTASGQLKGAAKQSLVQGGRPNLFPANEHDPVTDFYRLLPVILDRCFPSQQALHRQLLDPWRSHAFLRVRPPKPGTVAPSLVPPGPLQPTISRLPSGRAVIDHGTTFPVGCRVTGLRDESYTLYHALRAFGLIYATHSISRSAFELLYAYFTRDSRLSTQLPLTYRLLSHMAGEDHPLDLDAEEERDDARAYALRERGLPDPLRSDPGTTRAERDALRQARDRWRSENPIPALFDCSEEDWGTALPIPQGFFSEAEFPFPAHLVFYHACACRYLPCDVARRVFMGIGCTTKGRQRDQFRHYSLRLPAQGAGPSALDPDEHASFISRVQHRTQVASRFLASDCNQKLQRTSGAAPAHPPLHADVLRCLFQTLEESCSLYTHSVDPRMALGRNGSLLAPYYRGHAKLGALNTIDTRRLLMDPARPPIFPVDWDSREGYYEQEIRMASGGYDDMLCLGAGAPLYSDRVMPVWSSGLVELTEWPGNFERSGLRLDGSRLLSIGPGHAQRQLDRNRFVSCAFDARPFADAHPDFLATILLHPVREVCLVQSALDQAHGAAQLWAQGLGPEQPEAATSADIDQWVVSCPSYDPRFFHVLGVTRRETHTTSPGGSPCSPPAGSPDTSPALSPRRVQDEVQALDERIETRVAKLRRATYYYAHKAAREKRAVSVTSLMGQALFRADPVTLCTTAPNRGPEMPTAC